jgi:hypothetical protein
MILLAIFGTACRGNAAAPTAAKPAARTVISAQSSPASGTTVRTSATMVITPGAVQAKAATPPARPAASPVALRTPGTPSATEPLILASVVDTENLGVWMRDVPAGLQLKVWPQGTLMVVVGGEAEAAGRLWQNVLAPDGVLGWVASDYLELTDAAAALDQAGFDLPPLPLSLDELTPDGRPAGSTPQPAPAAAPAGTAPTGPAADPAAQAAAPVPPTQAPAAAQAPSATPTTGPTSTAVPTETPEPTSTPKPTKTPRPTEPPTKTPVPPTKTPVPPTLPPTATPVTPTKTPIPPTATKTPIPPTLTPTVAVPSIKAEYLGGYDDLYVVRVTNQSASPAINVKVSAEILDAHGEVQVEHERVFRALPPSRAITYVSRAGNDLRPDTIRTGRAKVLSPGTFGTTQVPVFSGLSTDIAARSGRSSGYAVNGHIAFGNTSVKSSKVKVMGIFYDAAGNVIGGAELPPTSLPATLAAGSRTPVTLFGSAPSKPVSAEIVAYVEP